MTRPGWKRPRLDAGAAIANARPVLTWRNVARNLDHPGAAEAERLAARHVRAVAAALHVTDAEAERRIEETR